MVARVQNASSKLYRILLIASAKATLVAYVLMYFFPFGPATWFIWIFLALFVLFLIWAPPLLLALLLYWPISRPFSFLPPWGRRLVGVLLTLAVLTATPLWVRAQFEHRAHELISGDMLEKPHFAELGVLALLGAHESGAKVSRDYCGDFCQRVLLNNEAKGVAVFNTRLLSETPDPSMRGTLYRFSPAEKCPQIKYSRARWITVKNEPPTDPAWAEEQLQREADEGRCVVMEQITLSQADIVVAAGLTKEGLEPGQSGFNLFADTMSARRIQVFEKRQDALQETYRMTDVTARLPTVPLIWAFNMEETLSGFRLKPGFVRAEIVLPRSGSLDLSGFLTATLGLNLGLEESRQP